MSLRLEITERAQKDVLRQYSWYVEHASEEIAERYLMAFYATAARLTAYPGLGQRQNYHSPKLRNLLAFRLEDSFNAHLLFYRTDDSQLIVARVMHGARDLPRRLRD